MTRFPMLTLVALLMAGTATAQTGEGVTTAAPAPKPADAAERAAAAEEAAAEESAAEAMQAEAAAEAAATPPEPKPAEAAQTTPETAPETAPAPQTVAQPDAAAFAPAMRAVDGTVAGPGGASLGRVSLMETPSGVILASLALEGLPAGVHAIHLHETGDCSGDFSHAGGHLAGGKAHGIQNADGPHPGDMPNITVPDSGVWRGDLFLYGLRMDQVMDDDGSAFVIHAGADDYYSQPAGDAGARLGCASLGTATN